MRRSFPSLFLVVSFFVVCFCLPGVAQSRRPSEPAAPTAGKRPMLSIRKLTGTGNRSEVTTPFYSTSVGRGARPARAWGLIEVIYDSYPEWIDELSITFYALSMRRDGDRNIYTFYRREIRYMDIKQAKSHLAAAYLRPSAIERYGEVVAAAVEFGIDGEVVAVENDSKMGNVLPPDWWKNERVIKSDVVTTRDGYLLNRQESPFAFINMDDYEAIK